MKAYWESGDIAPRILDHSTMWRRVVSFTPWPLYPRYPLDRKLDEPQSQSGRGGEERKSRPVPGIEPLSSSPQSSDSRYNQKFITTSVKVIANDLAPFNYQTAIFLRSYNCLENFRGPFPAGSLSPFAVL
jgi:hypothetical protein